MHTKRPIRLGATAAAIGMLLIAAAASAETVTLQLKRIQGDPNTWSPERMMCQPTQPQYFSGPVGDAPANWGARPDTKAFGEIVKKEPAYVAKSPVKGTIRLGGKPYAFAFDQSKADENKYDRLYFDSNGNGDLTDEKVIEPFKPKNAPQMSFPTDYAQFTFGPVDVKLDVKGAAVDYAFWFSAYSYTTTAVTSSAAGKQETQKIRFMQAQVLPAVYREGEITLDGVKHQVVLVDNNANGTFDDPTEIQNLGAVGPGARVYTRYGDVLLIDPRKKAPSVHYDLTANTDREIVSKLVSFGGKIYDMTVSPAGDKLTLEPSQTPVGFVTNANEGFRALIHGPRGVLRIVGGKDKKAAVPEGEWKLAQYTIDLTGWQPPKGATKEEKPGLLQSLSKAVSGTATGPANVRGPTQVSAAAGGDTPGVAVRSGETVELRFGPPLKPVVRAFAYGPSAGTERTVSLELAIVGSSGEQCTGLTVNGDRPAKPEFTITNPKGEVVQKGSFEYG